MGIEGTAKPEEIISAVEKAGYGASLKSENKAKNKELLQKEMPDWERWKNKLERFMI